MIVEQCHQQCLQSPAHGFWHHVGRLIKQIGTRIERRAELAYQRQMLLEMDDRLLKDVGISRADAEQLAGKCSLWGDAQKNRDRFDPRYRR